MTHLKIPNPATASASIVAGEPERVDGLGPMSAMPRRYSRDIRALVSLLRCYGKLDPISAARTLQGMAERLAAEVKRDHSACAVDEVAR